MKKIIDKVLEFFKSIRFNREKFENIIPYIVPEYWAQRKGSFLLFWFIGLFTIIFLIWGSFAEVNQVVKAQGVVKPDSKVHLIQSAIPGPIEKINVSLDDKVEIGDILFLIDSTNTKNMYDLAFAEVETRTKKVEILTKLVETGSDSEFRLLDEKLALINAQTRLDTAKRNLNFSSVKAPNSGSISKVTVANIGQVVQSGNLLAELVPEDDILRIEAAVQPKDVAYVRKGQKAKIGFSAYDTAIYGQFEGKVIKIAANTSSNEDGSSFYPALIEVDPSQFDEDNNITLQSGMITDVSIIGEERTVLSYIMNPITKLSQKLFKNN